MRSFRLAAALRVPVGVLLAKLRWVPVAAMLTLAACQNPNGSTDYGRTVLLGAGVGAAGAGLAGLLNDVGNSQRAPQYGYPMERNGSLRAARRF